MDMVEKSWSEGGLGGGCSASPPCQSETGETDCIRIEESRHVKQVLAERESRYRFNRDASRKGQRTIGWI